MSEFHSGQISHLVHFAFVARGARALPFSDSRRTGRLVPGRLSQRIEVNRERQTLPDARLVLTDYGLY
jgi:hypothetical protein